MPDREPLEGDLCALAERWRVDFRVLAKVMVAAAQFHQRTGRQVWIISGYRMAKEQSDLERAGRPTAPDALSTHRSCPATGIDVSLGAVPSRVMIAQWGELVILSGLRWGGGSEVKDGIPSDWGHVDGGPRSDRAG